MSNNSLNGLSALIGKILANIRPKAEQTNPFAEEERILREILDSLSKPWHQTQDLKPDNDCEKLKSLIIDYCNRNDRVLYSPITEYCFDASAEDADERIEAVLRNLKTLQHSINIPEGESEQQNTSENKAFSEFIRKAYDHVRLVSCQRSEINKHIKKIENVTNEQIDALNERVDERLQKIDTELHEATSTFQNAEKNLTNQIITIVGIFTALAFLLFGGISSLGTIASLVEVEFAKVLAFGTVWLFCMFNILGLFVYFILRITGRITEGITKRTTRTTDSGNKKGCAIFKAFFSRYGLFVSIDLVLLAGIGLALYFAMRR